ncbi:MAG: hypothetical protein LBT13_06195 [Treponema sp.]|jgi:hypothetical protein|nr:hypothetical protein [Treponema sp.]
METPGGRCTSPIIEVLYIVLGVMLAGFPGLLSAQVNTDELRKSQAPVEFLNYEGPVARVDSRAQIRGIGYTLGVAVNGGSTRTGSQNRYFVIHSVSAPEGDKLDADLFGLGADAGVDHIRNLRLIIQGYLEGAYRYSAADAQLLAQYITVYNAVYRRDWDYFSARYKVPVIQQSTPEQAGLSTRFNEWPGKTLLFIPLGNAQPGSLSAVDTTVLTDSRVQEELRKDEHQGIEQRGAMVEFKEREAAEAEERAATLREAEEPALREAEERAPQEERVQEQQERTGERHAETTPVEQIEVASREEAAQAAEALAEQKRAEIREEQGGIAEDQEGFIGDENPEVPSGIIGIALVDPDSPMGCIVKLNPLTGEEIKRSIIDTINARTVTLINNKLIAIAGQNRGNGAIRLVEIDLETLEMTIQGAEDIHRESRLWVNGSDLYAISSSGGNCYLARFNTALERQAQSVITVHPFATLNVQGNMLLTQRANGTAVILNPGDLTER